MGPLQGKEGNMSDRPSISNSPMRTWAEIDLNALVSNYRLAERLAAPSKVIAVVKADAYGHGAVCAAKALAAVGASFFAVATSEEAIELRAAGIKEEIMLLGVAGESAVPALAAADVILLINSPETAQIYAKAARGKTVRAHIMLDTGMNRLGIPVAEGREEAANKAVFTCQTPNLFVEGIATHLAASDDAAQADFTRGQIELFNGVSNEVIRRIKRPLLRHCANSAGVLDWPASYFDMVRPGIMLYGAIPDLHMTAQPLLRPVLSIRSTVTQVKTILPGATVGYGRAWCAEKQTRVATVPVGYADGLSRLSSGRIEMLVRGKRVKQIGRICMDLCMLDVTDVPETAVGDVVTIIGTDGAEVIPVWEMALANQTIPHEVMCAVGKRLPRFVINTPSAVDEV
jgi:alanine racemase